MEFGAVIVPSEPVSAVVRQVQLAESLGYDAAYITDSQMIRRELFVTLTACVLNTSRIKVGSAVNVAYTRHAGVIASAWASLSEMAEGRLVMGVGTGDSALGTLGLSMSKMAKIETVENLVSNVRALLQNKTVRFETGYETKLTWLDRPHHIPIIVAASGPRMLETAGRIGDGVFLHSCSSRQLAESALRYVNKGAQASGRTLTDLRVIVMAPTSVGRNRALARDHVSGRVASHLRHPIPMELSEGRQGRRAEDPRRVQLPRARCSSRKASAFGVRLFHRPARTRGHAGRGGRQSEGDDEGTRTH